MWDFVGKAQRTVECSFFGGSLGMLPVYEAEEIRAAKLSKDGVVLYEVKWKGYRSSDNGW